MSKINYFFEGTNFILGQQKAVTNWILSSITTHQQQAQEINFIFCSDEYLLQINREYLSHDYYTDIITFDQSEEPGKLEADIFISVERVAENACDIKVSFTEELHRVIIHGVLHLLGFTDKTTEEATLMRQQEDHHLSLRSF